VNDASVIIALIAGCLLGGVVVWLWVRGKIHQVADQAKGKFELQLAVSSERVADRDMEIAELRLESEKQKKQLAQLDSQLRDESTRRATGEERAKRIPQLEDQLANKDKQIGDLQNQITDLKSTRSELATALAKDREAFAEKLALLNEAQTRFSDAFKALSAKRSKATTSPFLSWRNPRSKRFKKRPRGTWKNAGKRSINWLDRSKNLWKNLIPKFKSWRNHGWARMKG